MELFKAPSVFTPTVVWADKVDIWALGSLRSATSLHCHLLPRVVVCLRGPTQLCQPHTHTHTLGGGGREREAVSIARASLLVVALS